MADLRTYSRSRVGQQWTELDHIFLVSTLDKIDKLAQAVHNLRAYTQGTRQDRAAAKGTVKA